MAIYIGVIIALAIIGWEKKKFQLKLFIIESILACFVIFLIGSLWRFLASKYNFQSFDIIPENMEILIGGVLIVGLVCFHSFREWKAARK